MKRSRSVVHRQGGFLEDALLKGEQNFPFQKTCNYL